MPDLTSCIQFSSVFSKKALIILCKTNLDPVCMAWSGLGQTDLVWKQAGVQKSPGLVSGRMHLACYQFPLSDLDSCTDGPDHIVQNQPGSDGFWLTVSGFGQMDTVRKHAGVQESSGPLLANASELIRIRCGLDPACLLGILLIMNLLFMVDLW